MDFNYICLSNISFAILLKHLCSGQKFRNKDGQHLKNKDGKNNKGGEKGKRKHKFDKKSKFKNKKLKTN